MNNLLSLNRFFKGIALILILIPPLVSASAMIIELAYDDGGAELFWSDYYPNGVAVEFSPPVSKWRITAIMVYGFTIDKGEKPFIVEVRDSDLNVILRASLPVSRCFKNATLHWAKMPLPNVVVKGDFYICVYPMLEFNGSRLWIAVDNDTAPNNCFLIDCYRQEVKSWKGGQVMIRVEGEEAVNIIEIVPHSVSIGEDALELSFKTAGPSNDIELKATIQAGSLIEDCEVKYEKGLYKTRVEWLKLSGLKSPVKLLLVAKALNSTMTLTVGLNTSLFSKYVQLEEENERLRAMVNSSCVELRDRLEKEDNNITLLSASLKEYREIISEKDEENKRLVEELNAMRLLTVSLAILTVFLLFPALRQRIHTGKFKVDENA